MSSMAVVAGNASKDRFLAAWFDGLLATAAALAGAALAPRGEGGLGFLGMVGGFLAYFFLFEWLTRSTPGKMIFGLWVRRLDGGRCSCPQAAVRTLLRLVEVNPLLFGALPAGVAILATGRRQRLGDLLAGTVVRKGRAE